MADPIPADGVRDVLHAIATDLQGQPMRYRWYGVWWWPIKAMLKRAGWGQNLPMLRNYLDPEAIATIPADLSAGQVLAEGLAQYQIAARFAPQKEWVDTPAGDDMIRIYDADVEA